MTHTELTEAIAAELRRAGVAFDRGKLLAWAEAMRPHLAEDPDAARWAREFAAARTATVE